MLNPAELAQSAVQACVDALVDSQGGLLLYDHGLAGREALLAAGAQLALTADLPLTVVDADALRDDTTALLNRLGVPHHVFLSPAEAAHWPTGFTPHGVLAIHADALLDPAVEEPLLAAAREANHAGHLLVARRPDGTPLLDAHTAQTHQLIADPMTTAQAQAATGTPARNEPGPPSDRPSPDDHTVQSPPPPQSASGIGPIAAAAARWETQAEAVPLQWIPPNPRRYAEAANWEEWARTFTDAAPRRPNRISRETVQRLQRFFRDLPALQSAEAAPPRHEQPDATSTLYGPLADASRPSADSQPPAHGGESLQQRPPAPGSTPASPAPEDGMVFYEIRTQTPAERAASDLQQLKARKQQLIRELFSPATWNTGSAEASVISAEDIEELNAALENPDPGLLQRVQEQAERMQAQFLAREEQEVAPARRRRVGLPPTAAQTHTTPEASPAQHDTARQHAHDQEQHRPQGPGRM
ncbi:hypothetical protein AB0B04_18745 [Streptomyces xinghaiensis]|uniref:hypothetical protein n=1 Tax=Streptomyces TaxID=1883 RepID=UPI0004D57581|nr:MULTISPECIES: hypothetical protein [Streptomyces]OFA48253.1 hypothetical protein BEN35_19120 [Streptomyces fradiae]